MVKLSGVKDQGTSDSAPTSSCGLICFICGASNANWPVYCRSRSSEKMPFFPFLEYHEPAEGARPVDKASGRIDSCTVCFSFLTQQWHAFEESDTPVIKRIYWLKRSGPDSSSERAQSPVGNRQDGGEESMAVHNTMAEDANFDTESPEEQCTTVQNELSEGNFNATTSDMENINPILDHSAGPFVENSSLAAGSRRPVGLETCYICSRRKPKEFMRSVHTRPQLKTETPFYPCLARHVPPTVAKQMDYLGKVLVCEACQKFLFRQWQVFQKNSTPLGERQYQLRSDPSLPREQQSQLSTMVCFICGVTQPATSGRFLYSRKHAPGHPYYPFLNNLPTPEGAMPLTKQGLTRACSGCRKSLHRQWKHFEAAGIGEDKREYRIRNDVMVQSGGRITDLMETSPIKIACYTCGQHCTESDLRPVHTRENTNPLKENLYFPFIASLRPPKNCRHLDTEGRTFVCKKCHKQLRIEWEDFEKNFIPQEERSYVLKLNAAITEDLDISSVCFLCGITTNASQQFKLYSYPHSGKGISDGGPFFPFLSSREPALNAQPINSEGTAVACEICYNNLMVQWNAYEKSDIPEESNRWLRKYPVASINCYLCCKQVTRVSCGAVNKQLITFPPNHQPPKTGIVVNNGRDVVLCNGCQKEVQRDLEAMDDSDAALGMLSRQQDSQHNDGNLRETDIKSHKSKLNSQGRVIVIDSSEESEEGDGSLARLQNKKVKLTSDSRSSNASPMHYTTSLSPGLQPVLHSKDSTPASADSSMSGGQASFAAALRKLAKQAKPVPLSTSSPAPSDSSSHSASPGVSAVSAKTSGMSPSRTSPAIGQTEMNSKDRGDRQSPGVIAVRTPPVQPAAPAVDPDHRNHRPGEQTRDPSRGPQRPEVSHPRLGREVMPGVYSTVPRGHSEVPMLSEHYPGTEPPHAPVAFYPAYGAKPDLPIYVPRGAHPPGPPPLLASKRDGPEAHMLPAFYPTPYPPPVMDPHDMRFNTWRQQRAAEHLRQQHERHSILPDGSILVEPYDIAVGHAGDAARHLPPGSVESFVRKNSPHLRPGDNPESRETRKQETSEPPKKDKENDSSQGEPKRSSGEGPLQRGFHHEHKHGSSCPVHGLGTPGAPPTSSSSEPPRTHGLHVRADPAMVSKLGRPGEFKRMFLPAHDVPMLHPYLVHGPRDAPYPLHPLDERHAEFVRERERQEFLLHERMMFEQKEGLRAPGEDWPRHHMSQEKPGGIGVVHYPQALHQRLDASKSPHSIDHHKGDPALARMVAGREAEHLYRGFPFHPFHHPTPDGKGFGDRYGNELDLRHLHPESVRRSAGAPSDRLGARELPYLDSHPFSREGFRGNTQRESERPGVGERDWQRRDRVALVNGDYQPDLQRPKSSDRSSPSLAPRIKVERTMEEPLVKAAVKIRHNPHKLKFLEGLGLVTVDRKREISQGGATLKRKFEGDHDNQNGIDSPINLMTDSEVTNGDQNEHEENTPPPLPSAEKLDFMAKLGLLPPSKRQELVQTYEIKRTERKNRKSRGRPPKRARRDKENDRDSDNSQGSLDPDTITGPITRQKQQLLQEQERKENKNKDVPDKQQPVTIKTEDGDKRIAQYPHERTFRRGSDERYRQSPTMTSSSNHIPPRLTLQSLTNMEDPFSNVSASQFRPPYLRHTGLLSISHEHGSVPSHARPDHRAVTQPIRPEPLRSIGISLSEQETRDYLSQHPTGIQGRQFGPLPLSEQLGSRNKQEEPITKDEMNSSSRDREGYKWAGIEAVMRSYYTHAAERGLEIGVLQDNADVLKSQNISLNEEAQALSLQMTNLVQAKKDLLEERNTLRDGLDKLHFFIESLKR